MIDWQRSDIDDESWLIATVGRIKVVLQAKEDGTTAIAWVIQTTPDRPIDILNGIAREGAAALERTLVG